MRSTNNDSRMTHHRAFTLIELLVVIAIIGVLIGLLLPAVQQVRESARMLSCKNNLKQIGLALHNYHDANRSFPPFFTSSGGNETRIADQTGKSANWCVLILPYMEQSVIYDQRDFDLPHIKILSDRNKSLPFFARLIRVRVVNYVLMQVVVGLVEIME